MVDSQKNEELIHFAIVIVNFLVTEYYIVWEDWQDSTGQIIFSYWYELRLPRLAAMCPY